MRKRADGRFEKKIVFDEKTVHVYGRSGAEIERKIAEMRLKKKQEKTFAVYAERWLEKREGEIEFNTHESYRHAIKRAAEFIGDVDVAEITPADVDNLLRALKDRGYAAETASGQRSVLRLIFDAAIIDGIVERNPCNPVRIPRGMARNSRSAPPPEEIEAIKHGVNEPFGLFAFLLLYAGLRRNEALALEYSDFDFDNKIIRVDKSVVFKYGKAVVKPPKTKSSCRTVALLDVLAEKIDKAGSGLLFPNQNGGYMGCASFNSRWKKYAASVGITATPHQLRHAYSTILFEAGVPDKDAQELLGHASITTTRNIYTHISRTRAALTAQKLNDFLSLQNKT